jgi:succinyl-diaminopimelate desuccinylase
MSADLLLAWIDRDRDRLIGFLQALIRARSPNPPGDTTGAAKVVAGYLADHDLECQFVEPLKGAPNIVSSFATADGGPHLVLNGHLDTYPCDDAADWSHDPFGGEIAGGSIFGRGSSDMKAGTAALTIAYAYLSRLKDRLRGRITYTAVSDEETGGVHGARYLIAHCDVVGDCLLNGEPGAPTTIRFGEKGSLKLRFSARTLGCHGAYTHKSKSATKLAAALIGELEEIAELKPSISDNIVRLLDHASAEFDRVHLPGASRVLRDYTVNVGVVRGGVKMNMLPSACDCEVDIRVPIGGGIGAARDKAAAIAARFPEIGMSVIAADEPSWSDPDHPLVEALRASCARVIGGDTAVVTSLGATDARHWRAAGVPSFTYGTTATNVAMADEHTAIDEWIEVIKVHALSIHRLLGKS